MSIVKNTHNIDRVVRVVAGLGLLGSTAVGPWWLAIPGVVLLGTAIAGFCPLYKVIGVSTCKVPEA